MSLSIYVSYHNSILYRISYVYFLINIYSLLFGMCSGGLEVGVEDLLPRGLWFESPVEQFLLKTRAVNSILWNRNMIGKIPTWWENSVRGNRKTVGKTPPWWEISLSGRKKVFRCMNHLVLRHPSYMRGFTYPFSLSVLPTVYDLNHARKLLLLYSRKLILSHSFLLYILVLSGGLFEGSCWIVL